MDLTEQKHAMRRLAKARRQSAFRATGPIGDARVEGFSTWANGGLKAGSVVSVYHPIRDEADSLPLIGWLADNDYRTCLPVTFGRSRPLVFRQWRPSDPLVAGGFDVMEPPDSAADLRPDVLLIPLLAFDLSGGRLGYGAGHYDRTLASMDGRPPIKIGVAYSAQLVDAVPMGPTDQRLDAVLTENGLKWVAGPGAMAAGSVLA